MSAIILNRGNHLLFPRVPPIVAQNAVAVGVSAGKQRGMAGGGDGVGIVVIAVGEIGAVVEQEAKSAFAKLVAIAFQIVAAELVDDNDDHQLRLRVVGRAKTGLWDEQRKQKNSSRDSERKFHRGGSVQGAASKAKLRAPDPSPPLIVL